MDKILEKESTVAITMVNGAQFAVSKVHPEDMNIVTLGDKPNLISFMHIYDHVHNIHNYVSLGAIVGMSFGEESMIVTPESPPGLHIVKH